MITSMPFSLSMYLSWGSLWLISWPPNNLATNACNVKTVMLRETRLMVAWCVFPLINFNVTKFDTFGVVETKSSGKPYSVEIESDIELILFRIRFERCRKMENKCTYFQWVADRHGIVLINPFFVHYCCCFWPIRHCNVSKCHIRHHVFPLDWLPSYWVPSIGWYERWHCWMSLQIQFYRLPLW